MEAIIKATINTLIVLICIVLLIAISTGAFVAAGYILSLILPVTLFQSSVLCIGATFVFAFIISAVTIGKHIFVKQDDKMPYIDDDDDEDGEDEDEEEYVEREERKIDNLSDSRFTVVHRRKVGRNEPCPCGSGKKYKYCCGK